MGRTHRLWTNGYFNALAPSDAVEDGRIKIEDGGFDFCGHKFKKLLYLYPEYSKPAVVSFLNDVAKQGIDMACGSGYFTRFLKGKGFDVYGVDNSEKMLARANEISFQEKLVVDYQLQDIKKFKSFKKLDFVTVINDGFNYLNKN